MKSKKIYKLILASFFTAIIFLGTFVIKIPIPNGYIHFGDGFIYVAAAMLPLPFSMAAAALGGFLSDIIAGFSIYAPFTAVIKLLMAVLVGIITKNNMFIKRIKDKNSKKGGIIPLILASVAGGIINVAGYFVTDTILFGSEAAVPSVPLNILQSGFGVAVFFIFLPILVKIFARFTER